MTEVVHGLHGHQGDHDNEYNDTVTMVMEVEDNGFIVPIDAGKYIIEDTFAGSLSYHKCELHYLSSHLPKPFTTFNFKKIKK